MRQINGAGAALTKEPSIRKLQAMMTAIFLVTVPLAPGCPKSGEEAADMQPSTSTSAPTDGPELPSSTGADTLAPPPSAAAAHDDASRGQPTEPTRPPPPGTGPPPADIQLVWAKASTSASVRRLRRGEAGYEPSGPVKTMPAAWARQMTALLKRAVERREAGGPAKRCRFDPGVAVSLEQANGPTAYAELCFTCGDVRFGEHTLDFLPDAARVKALVRKALPSGGLEPVESETK